MKNSKTQTQKILKYLYGEMKDLEKAEFENELSHQETLRKEFYLQQNIDKAISDELKVEKFKAALPTIHERVIEKKERKILNLKNKWYWAAASITLFSGTATYSIRNHFQKPQHLYDDYYHIWQPSFLVRGLESEHFTQNIITRFEQGNFNDVIKLLENNYANLISDPKLILIKGCAEMETLNFNAAIETFHVFDSKDYTFYTEAGQWYQALCYLKIEDIQKSKEKLEQIIEGNTSYTKEARELLEKLK